MKRLPALRHHRPVTSEPSLHLRYFALLLDDHRFGKLPCPWVFGVAHRDLSHVDGPLMMGDHLNTKVHVGITRVWQRHVAHHGLMSGFELARGRCCGSGTVARMCVAASGEDLACVPLVLSHARRSRARRDQQNPSEEGGHDWATMEWARGSGPVCIQ